MVNQIFRVILLLTGNFFFCQDYDWGKVSAEEIAIEEVEFEPGAEAVRLKEVGYLKITNDGYELTEYIRTKILSPKGLHMAEEKWSYRPKKLNDKVTLIDAQTINIIDGKPVVTPMDKKDIITSNVNDLEEVAYAFRNVKVGSIIEYKVKILRPSNLYASPWRFQNDIPTISSKLFLDLVADADYKIILKGEMLTKKYSSKKKNKEWELANIPSDKIYKNVYNADDYRERIMYQYSSAREFHGTYYSENTWKGFKKLINEDVGKSKKNVNFQEIANKIENGKTKLETLKNCITFLRENYQWNRYTSVQTFDLAYRFLRTKTGNSADFNIVLNEILRIKNIKAELAINSMRSNGRIIVAYPAFSKLQTLINIVETDNGEKLLIDAATTTSKNVRFTSLEFFNHIVLSLDSRVDDFIAVSPTLSEYVSLQKLNIEKESSTLNIHNQSKGYFNSESYDDKDFDVFAGNSTKGNAEEKSEWNIVKKTVDFDNPSNNIFLIENPLAKLIRTLTVEKNRNYPIELEFPFLATIQLKTRLSAHQEIATEDFNQKISALNNNLQYIQEIKTVEDEEVITWSLLIKQSVFMKTEISEYNNFISQLHKIISKGAVIKNKKNPPQL